MTCFAPGFAECAWSRLCLQAEMVHVAAVAAAD